MSNEPSVRLSLVVPVFNRAHLVGETLDAALAQSMPFHEIIVIDDGSTDGTASAVAAFGDRVRVITTINRGVQHARNLGVQNIGGSHAVFCDSDDLLPPNFVAATINSLHAAPFLDALYCNFANFSTDRIWPDKLSQAPSGWLDGAATAGHCLYDIPDLYRKTLAFQPLFPTGLTIQRGFYDRIGGFNPAFNGVGGEDWEFTLRVIAAGRVGIQQPVLASIRRHDSNDSSSAGYMAYGEAQILSFALAHHATARADKLVFEAAIDERLELAFDAYFASGDFAHAEQLLTQMRTSPRTAKFLLKRWLTRSPRPLRHVAWWALQRR